jgi:Fur family ferric uptake transcriptional regulator
MRMICRSLRAGLNRPKLLRMNQIDPPVGDMIKHAQVLREAGLRVTQQRTAIVTALAAADDHPTADDLWAKARALDETVSIATVYRTLVVLEDAKLIRKLSFEDAPARYEMTPQSDHDHLVDVDTGELIEISGDEIAGLSKKIAKELGYALISHYTVLRGRRQR